MSGALVVIFLGGIIGADLAPYPSWATLPIALMIIGMALFTIPASLLMKKIGRRSGFILAVCIAALASLGAAYAIQTENFFLFCAAVFFIGGNMAFVQQYRFAAAESVDSSRTGRAISLVLVGGVLGGYLGPEVAKRAKDFWEFKLYAGSFISLAFLYCLSALLLCFLRDIKPEDNIAEGEERPIRAILIQPLFYTAILGGVVGYAVMSLIMTATPISMHIMDGYSLDETAWVIQSHLIAMYLPSLFTGHLVHRFGVLQVMISGVLLLFVSVSIALLHSHLLHYWMMLVLLGVGWNFLFVGGTILLTRNYRPTERFKAQTTSDFTIFGIQALTSLSAGTLIYLVGWNWLNMLTLPVLVIILLLLVKRRMESCFSHTC